MVLEIKVEDVPSGEEGGGKSSDELRDSEYQISRHIVRDAAVDEGRERS